MATHTIPPATYPVGATKLGQVNQAGLTANTASCQINGATFTDPASRIFVAVEILVAGKWLTLVTALQQGSVTGTWPSDNTTTNLCVDMTVNEGPGFTCDGVRGSITVSGSPANLGQITLSWA